MSDTPRTTNLCARLWKNAGTGLEMIDHARQLERELAAAISRCESLARAAELANALAGKLGAELDDICNSMKGAMDETCDDKEKHCTCVPLLRARVRELEGQLASVTEALAIANRSADDQMFQKRERDEYEKNNAARLREHRRYEIARDCMAAFASAPPDDVAILEDIKGAAECAVKWADALLAELEKSK